MFTYILPELNYTGKERFIIYGAGEVAYDYHRQIKDRYPEDIIAFYIESKPDKSEFLGKKVYRSEFLVPLFDFLDKDKFQYRFVIASIAFQDEMAAYLISIGVKETSIIRPLTRNILSVKENTEGKKNGAPVHDFAYRTIALNRFRDFCNVENSDILEVGSDMECSVVRELARDARSVVGITKDEGHWLFENSRAQISANATMYNGDIRDTDFESGSFDAIISISTFEHINDLHIALEEMYRILRPGGIVYSRFGPIWSSPVGHHVCANVDGQAVHFWSKEHNPIPNCYHLLLQEEEMFGFLLKEHDEKYARVVSDVIYKSDFINRLFYSDYLRLAEESRFSVEHFKGEGVYNLDKSMEKILNDKYGEENCFKYSTIEMVLRK